MIYQGQPPCDPNTWEVHLDQRRAIDAWIRSREVKCALPQRASVLKPDRAGKPLFLKKAESGDSSELAPRLPCKGKSVRNRGVSQTMPFLVIPRSLLRGGFIQEIPRSLLRGYLAKGRGGRNRGVSPTMPFRLIPPQLAAGRLHSAAPCPASPCRAGTVAVRETHHARRHRSTVRLCPGNYSGECHRGGLQQCLPSSTGRVQRDTVALPKWYNAD